MEIFNTLYRYIGSGRHSLAKIGIFLFFTAFLSACSINKIVPDGEALLVKNKVDAGKGKISSTDIGYQIKHEPSRKGLFQHARFKQYLKTKNLDEDERKGVEPIFFDSTKADLSALNIQNYLFNSGFYDASVTYTVKLKGRHNKKAVVTYHVAEGEGYRIGSIIYQSAQVDILTHVKNAIDSNKIHVGARIDHDELGKQRDRIASYIRDEGYYSFNRSFVNFQLDTNQVSKKVTLKVNVNSPEKGYHEIYSIGSVQVRILHSEETEGKTKHIHDRIEYEIGDYKLKPDILSKNIRIRPYQQYEQTRVDITYRRLINLGLFKLVNIHFLPINDSSTVLTAIILCEPNKKYDFIWEPQVLTSDQRVSEQTSTRNYGVANVFTLKNRNIFYNGEEFDLRSRTAFEAQFSQDSVKVLKTFSQELNAELRIPKLLFLDRFNTAPTTGKSQRRFAIPPSNRSQTRMNLAMVYENNPFYLRRVLPLDMTYEFIYDQTSYYWKPAAISLNQSKVSESFLNTLNPSFQTYYDRLFTNNLITSTRLIIAHSNRNRVYTNDGFRPGSYFEILSNAIELAGIGLPYLTNEGELFNVQHASFVRTDVDVRWNRLYNRHTSWVIRAYAGIGVPFNNTILPYDRRYYVGGANSLRGWRPRTVGPGSYSSTSGVQIDRSGEILMQANAEYRFDIYTGVFDLELAMFMDAGNVWTFNNANYPGGKFTPESLKNDLAINTGLGIRFDFTYFLFRLDYGIPVKDPNLARDDRWVILKFVETKGNRDINIWNVAINYPF